MNQSIDELIAELHQLRIRERRVIALLEQATRREGRAGRNQVIRAGTRIQITNGVKKPTYWDTRRRWDHDVAALATVDYTTSEPNRVYFTTDNGLKTWRAPHNITLLETPP
jgi:hypothetical protein